MPQQVTPRRSFIGSIAAAVGAMLAGKREQPAKPHPKGWSECVNCDLGDLQATSASEWKARTDKDWHEATSGRP